MQTRTEIRQILKQAGLTPKKTFGQNFLIDHNLMAKVVGLADLKGDETVLEVGPGTGSLTEELLPRCRKLLAVEIDRGLADLLTARLGDRPNFQLLRTDILAGKHQIAPEVLAALGGSAHLVSNLPYNVATPLVAQCLIDSWRVMRGPKRDADAGAAERPGPCGHDATATCRFERLTFMVQKEVAERLVAVEGSGAYGPVSVVVNLLSRATLGPVIPASAFWPAPTIASRIVRLDFDPARAGLLADIDVLSGFLAIVFGQRRKQIGAILRKDTRFPGGAAEAAVRATGVELTARAEQLPPAAFLAIANALSK